MRDIKKFIWKLKKCKKCGVRIRNWKRPGYIGPDTIVCGICMNKEIDNSEV